MLGGKADSQFPMSRLLNVFSLGEQQSLCAQAIPRFPNKKSSYSNSRVTCHTLNETHLPRELSHSLLVEYVNPRLG